MIDRIRILGVSVLAAVYCMAVGSVICLPVQPDIAHHSSAGQEQFYAAFSKSLFSPAQPTDHAKRTVSGPSSVPPGKHLINSPWSVFSFNERLLETVYTRYCSHSADLLVYHRKSDRIFPFHYFW